MDQTINVNLRSSENTVNALLPNSDSLPLRLVVGGNRGSKLTLSTISGSSSGDSLTVKDGASVHVTEQLSLGENGKGSKLTINGSGSALTVDGALSLNDCSLVDHAVLNVGGRLTITEGATFTLDETSVLNLSNGLVFERHHPSTWAWLSDYLPDGYSLERDGNNVVVLDGSGQPATTIRLKHRVPAIQSGVSAPEAPFDMGDTTEYSRVSFGMDGASPILWRVLDASATNTGAGGAFLLSDGFITGNSYQAYENSSNYKYQPSDLRKLLETNTDSVRNTAFSTIEQNAMLETRKTDSGYNGSLGKSSALNYDKLFLLSAEEADSAAYFPNGSADRAEGGSQWWLRSPAVDYPWMYGVNTAGGIEQFPVNNFARLRPAFNLNANQVLFASAAVGGKSAAGMDGKLTAVGTSATGDWKLTLQDNGWDLSMSPPFGVYRFGDVLKMSVTLNDSEMTNRYVSAIIKDQSGAITHYGRLVKVGDVSILAVEIDLSGIDMTNHTLYLFLEQYNGDGQTDYAGSLRQVSIPAEMKLELEGMTAFNFGAVYAGYTQPAAQTVTLRNASPHAIKFKVSTDSYDYHISVNGGDPAWQSYSLNPDESAVLTVQPKAELGEGSYNGSIRVYWYVSDIGFDQNIDLPLGFEVRTAPAAMQSGFAALQSPTVLGGLTAYSRLYFGMDGASPILWRVLDASKTNTDASGALLLSEEFLPDGAQLFSDDFFGTYPSSIPRGMLQTKAESVLNTAFGELERSAMQATTKSDSEFALYSGTVGYAFSAQENILNDDTLFLLSAEEAASSLYFPQGNQDRAINAQTWWLRSQYSVQFLTATIIFNGGVNIRESTTESAFLRPAFNLDTAKVLFATTASGLSSGDLAPVGTNTTDEWKLTLPDESRSFAVSSFTQTSDRVTVSVTGAGTGSNEYVSAVVQDSLGGITHYGRVAAPSGGTGDVAFTLTGIDLTNKTIFVFSEQDNGANKTNFASNPIKLANPTVTSVTVSPATASVVKGATQSFTATVSGENDPPQTVTWSVAGNSSADTVISTDGVLSVALGETAASLTVTATSTFDTAKYGTAAVTLTNPPPTVSGVTVSPATAIVVKGTSQSFTATVEGTNNPSQTVAWSVADGSAAKAVRLSSATAIDANGRLTVGADETARTLIVTAISDFDKTKSGTAAVTVRNPAEAIVITRQPAEQRVTEGQRATFSLAAEGDGLTYQWSIDRNDGAGWRTLDGATSASYTTTATVLANDGFRYRCTIEDASGATLDSDIAALRVVKAVIPPKTGDSASLLLWLGLCLLGGAGVMGIALGRRRRA